MVSPPRCERRDSNPHGFPHRLLRPARLPDSATLATTVYAGRGRVIAPAPRSVNPGRLLPRVDGDEPRRVARLPEADQHLARGAAAHELDVLDGAAVRESPEDALCVVLVRLGIG